MMIEQSYLGQDELKYVYESAKERIKCHPKIADKYRKMLEKVPSCKDREEALRIANNIRKNGSWGCQVWAKVDKNEEYYYIEDYYIVSADNFIKMAAEYIGMEQLY